LNQSCFRTEIADTRAPSGNHDAVLSAKLDPMGFDGKLHHPAGFAFAADVVNAGDEFAKRPGYLRGIIFHACSVNQETARRL